MSSRVCVKNLPKHLSVERFRQHFQQKGEVTDAKILKTTDGKSRLMGFIGYKTPQEAKDAVHFFNNTFLDTSKITVELAKPVGDKNMSRPWSKYSKGSSGNTKMQKGDSNSIKKNTEDKNLNNIDTDKDLNKFLNIMKPRANAKFWENESITDGSSNIGKQAQPKKIKFESSDDEKEENENEEETTEQPVQNSEERKVVYDSTISDMDYLMSKKRKLDDDSKLLISTDENSAENSSSTQTIPSLVQKKQKVDSSSNNYANKKAIENSSSTPIDQSKTPSASSQKDSNKSSTVPFHQGKENTEEDEDIGSTGRLFVRNLSYSVTEAELIQLFSKYGAIIEVHIPVDAESKKGKGISFIQFANHQSAINALSNLDGSIFQGRLIHILPAKSNAISVGENKPSIVGKSKKEKREAEKKVQSQNEVSWNSLFMRADATADSLASRLQISKGELLDGREISSDNMAVRLALGETHLINETKKVLEKEGVNLDILGKHSDKKFPRSSSILLVKNIPYDSKVEEFKQMFARYGELGRVILPPAKTIVLVEFLHSNDAKKAFKELSYRKFKHVPLYLEWAPAKLFDVPPPMHNEDKTAVESTSNDAIELEKKIITPDENTTTQKQRELVKEALTEEDTSSANSSTVYVKNLNFITTEESLRSFFANIGEIRNISVAKKKDMKNPGNMLSMGFGFVEFVRRDDAVKAVKNLQGKVLDDHAVVLKLSVKGQDEQKTKTRKAIQQLPETTKLVIRNVPFEAKKQDIRDLCKAFGQVKSVRLPLKFDGKTRGFAFVEFLTKQEAKNAYEALQNTHLYGRHLVIEYSSVDDQQDLQSIRQKTERYFDSIKASKSK